MEAIERLESENTLLREQIRKVQNRYEYKIAELSMVREIGMALLHVRDFRRVCELVLEVVINNTVARNCSVMLLDQDRNQLFLVCATDPRRNNYFLDATRIFSKEDVIYTFKSGEGAAGRAMDSKQPVLVHDMLQSSFSSLQPRSRVRIGSLLSVPLMVEGVPIGVLNLSHSATGIFGTDDVNLFNIIANFVAIAIHSTLNYERLRHSEEIYRALAENSNDGIAVLQDGRHIYSNPVYRKLLDRSIEDLEKIPFEALLYLSDSQIDPLDVQALLHGKSGRKYLPMQLRGRGEKRVYAEINGSSITYNDKPALMVTVRDLAEQMEIQKKLQHAQKMEAIGALAGGVAHDLNNILSGLVGYPELVLMELSPDDSLRKPIQTMQKSGEKAAAIVQDLLTLARRGVTVKEAVNLNRIVSEYLSSPEYKKLMDFHPHIRLQVDLDRDLLNILGSALHLSKAAMNLVSNAAEAMPDGGEISIATQNLHVERPIKAFETVERGDYVTLTVSDSGTGISSIDVEKIFEPFYTKKVMGRSGTGLGMSVVWGTVKDHNGTISVQSTEGKGSTFTLYFPVTEEKSSGEEFHPSIDLYRGHGESVVVVDDVKEQREIASQMLNKLGYSVTTLSCGEEAVRHMENHSADLLILDMLMEPGMDGLETYKEILKLHPGQRAIIVSGFSETSRVKEVQRLGAGQYVKKPYTMEKIGIAAKTALKS